MYIMRGSVAAVPAGGRSKVSMVILTRDLLRSSDKARLRGASRYRVLSAYPGRHGQCSGWRSVDEYDAAAVWVPGCWRRRSAVAGVLRCPFADGEPSEGVLQ